MAPRNDKAERLKDYYLLVQNDHETEATSDDPGRIRQGDIIEWICGSNDPFKMHAVIVTADCDLAQNKTRGVITYAPIFSLPSYISNFYIADQLEKSKESLFKILRDTIHSLQKKYIPNLSLFSDTAIHQWPMRENAAAIAQKFTGASGNESRNLEMLILQYTAMCNANLAQKECLKDIVNAYSDIICVLSPNPKEKFCKDLNNHINNLPGDTYFIHDIAPNKSGGFVTMLRYICQCQLNEIAVSTDNESVDTKARRISRLKSPYIYSLTQSLGNVFSDIGLPSRRDRILKAIVDASLNEDVAT